MHADVVTEDSRALPDGAGVCDRDCGLDNHTGC